MNKRRRKKKMKKTGEWQLNMFKIKFLRESCDAMLSATVSKITKLLLDPEKP